MTAIEPPMTTTTAPARKRRASVRFGFWLTAAITAYAQLVFWVFKPLHARGLGQPLLGFLDGLDYFLQAPGLMAALGLGLRDGHHFSLFGWLFGLVLNGIVYFLAGLLLAALWQWAGATSPRPPPAVGSAPSRRGFLRTSLKVVGGGAVAGLGYGLVVEPRWFQISHRVVPIRDLPATLDGLRLVQLTDIHHGPWLSLAYVRQVIDAANRLGPDVLLLTGDYVYLSGEYIKPVVAELARLQAKVGIVAVLGNHDWWEDASLTREQLARAGIPAIDNDRRIVTPDRRLVSTAAEGLALAGVGDLWEDRVDCQRALDGLPQTMPRLLLSHNPDVAEERQLVTSGLRVDLMVSGHTHGGQINLPFVGPLVVASRFGRKYARGLVQGPVCPVFVCSGIGIAGLPLRVGALPEIAVLELQQAR
jgi:predicted MPP superfamily phosphohydrolase